MGGNVNTIHYLAPKMESLLHSSDDNGCNMINCAAEFGHADVVEFVIEEYKLGPTSRDKVSVY